MHSSFVSYWSKNALVWQPDIRKQGCDFKGNQARMDIKNSF